MLVPIDSWKTYDCHGAGNINARLLNIVKNDVGGHLHQNCAGVSF